MQQTLDEFSQNIKKRDENYRDSAQSLENIIHKIQHGEEVDNEQILKVAALFDDHITLDNMDVTQLANLCRFMNVKLCLFISIYLFFFFYLFFIIILVFVYSFIYSLFFSVIYTYRKKKKKN